MREGVGASRAGEASENAQQDDSRPRVRPAFTGPAAAGLEAIASAEPDFDPEDFLRGARSAYEMVVNAFADGDRDALRTLVDDDVYEIYDAAITDRQATGQEPLRLLRVKSARLAEASLGDDGYARVGVSFESELSDGENLRKAKEIWTFKRRTGVDDPNWLLDEVGVAS